MDDEINQTSGGWIEIFSFFRPKMASCLVLFGFPDSLFGFVWFCLVLYGLQIHDFEDIPDFDISDFKIFDIHHFWKSGGECTSERYESWCRCMGGGVAAPLKVNSFLNESEKTLGEQDCLFRSPSRSEL